MIQNVELAALPVERPSKVGLGQLLLLNLYWFANSAQWGVLLGVALASQVEKFGASKELSLAMVVAPGTIASVLAHPLAGALSDRLGSRWGRRRPFLFWWTIPNVLALVGMAYARSVLVMSGLFVLIQITNNMANAPWTAVVADRVPKAQRGAASGWTGLMATLGTVFGAGVLGRLLDKQAPVDVYAHQLFRVYGGVSLTLMACVALSVAFVEEEPSEAKPRLRASEYKTLLWIDPRRYPDLFWVFLARFFVSQGIWSVYTFLQYYYEDVLHLPGEKTVANFQVALMLASMLTVLTAGMLSDRWGRKTMVYISSGLMTLVCVLFVVCPSPALVIPCALLFGAGLGAFTSVDQALAMDALPDATDAGKLLGVWMVAAMLPQVTGIICGGVLLNATRGSQGHLGYTLLFLCSIVCCGLGTALIRKVKG